MTELTMNGRLIAILAALIALLAGCGSSSDPHHDAQSPVADTRATPDPGVERVRDLERPRELAAPGADATTGGTKVGDPCTTTAACPAGGSGKPACRSAWPEGYCLVEDCTQHGHDCPGDPGRNGTTGLSKCVLAPTAACLKMCAQDGDCRAGYACVKKPDAAGHGSADVCVPK